MKNSRFRFVGLILAVLLIAAATHAQVQVVNSLITTFAGGGAGCAGQTDSIGDGCPVADSGLRNPTGVALDSAGNLYIVDDFDNVIRKVSAATGEITTVAGSGTGCTGQTDSLGDGCPATSAQLSNPRAIAVDSAGNFYIADYGNQRIRKVTEATGIITTVGGNGTAGYLGDNNPATSAELDNPTGLAVNSSGTLLYIADSGNNVVRMVNLTSGTITTVAGNGFGSGTTGGGYTGDTGPATNAEMWNPSGVALDSSGNLYIADTYNSAIREVNASTQKITTVAGYNGSPNYGGDGGLATLAYLYYPNDVAVDSAGNLYIADSYNCLIREVNAVTGIITTVAGNPQSAGLGVGTFGGDNGPATLANLNIPDGVAVDSAGNLYIADTLNYRVRKVAAPNSHLSLPVTNVGSVSASQSTVLYIDSSLTIGSVIVAPSLGGVAEFTVGTLSGCVADGVTPIAAGSLCMVPITFKPGYPGLRQAPLELQTSAGTFYFGLAGIGLGPQPALLPGVISTVAGTGATGYTGDNGLATSATFSGVFAVSVDYAGNQYIDDYNNNVFRKVTAATGIVTTYAGNGTIGYSGDNFPATSAQLDIDWAAGTDGAGNLFIADTNNNVIREVNAATDIITTVTGACCSSGGEGLQGYNGDDIPAVGAELFLPEGVATDPSGNFYIADYGNNRVREVNVATGIITTVAGNGFGNGAKGTGGYTGDNHPATSAELNGPSAVALDSAANIYFADFFNNAVRKVTVATGIITTVAGDGTHGDIGDGGPATSAELASPTGVALDAAGDIYIVGSGSGGGSIRKVDAATGIITTVAGGGTGCTEQTDSLGDGCGATSAEVSAENLAVDGPGNLYIADFPNNRVRKVSLATAPITFPQTALGSSSAVLTFKVANIGTAPLNLSAITPTANFSVDSGTTTCSTSTALAAGDSCVIGVVFSPTTGGVTTGTLTLTDNALNVAGTTQQVALNGTVGATSDNPVPVITTLLPIGTTAGSGAFTLTVNGTGFINGSVVNFNGNARTTTYVSATQVTAAILATDVASVGTPAVTVTNPTPGGGTSNAVTFTVSAAPLIAQTITFANPGAQTVGTPLTLSATATSGIAVTFTSTTTGVCTVAGTTATFVTTGTCTIDANQVGNSTYAAATMVPQSFAVNAAPLTAQTITFANPGAQTVGTPLTLSATATSGLAVTFTSTTTGVCTVAGATATFVTTGSCTIDANQVGNSTYAAATMVPQSFAVNAALAPSFTIASSTGAHTVQPGGAATYTINITPVNGLFSGVVTLSVGGLPPGATATFLPATLTPGNAAVNSTLTIQTAATGAAVQLPPSPWPLAAPALALIGLFFVPGKRRRRWITLGVLLFASLGAVAALSGCGGGFAMGSNSKSYTVTVTGTSSANIQTTTVQLTVK